MRNDALLCSINDRLGGKPGQDIEPLDNTWLLDAISAQKIESDELKKTQDEIEENRNSVDSYRSL